MKYWTSVYYRPIPKDGKEYLTRNDNLGGLLALIRWNERDQSYYNKSFHISEKSAGTHWMNIPDRQEEKLLPPKPLPKIPFINKPTLKDILAETKNEIVKETYRNCSRWSQLSPEEKLELIDEVALKFVKKIRKA